MTEEADDWLGTLPDYLHTILRLDRRILNEGLELGGVSRGGDWALCTTLLAPSPSSSLDETLDSTSGISVVVKEAATPSPCRAERRLQRHRGGWRPAARVGGRGKGEKKNNPHGSRPSARLRAL
jgi:hypothetical protein